MKKLLLLLFAIIVSAGAAMAANYKKVTSTDDLSGNFLIVCEDQNKIMNGVEAASNNQSVTITSNEITGDYTAYEVEIAAISGGYSIKILGGTNAGKFITSTNSKNSLIFKTSETDAILSITFNSGNAVIGATGTTLQYNKTSGQERFRFFTSNQTAIQLYKLQTGNTPARPDCEITWMVNGTPTTTTQSQGSTITLADAPDAPEGYAFMGWTASSTVNANGTGFTYLDNNATVPTTDTATYYAVFAKKSIGKKTINYSWEENEANEDLFTNTLLNKNTSITAASGSKYGTNVNKDGNNVNGNNCSIQTKNKYKVTSVQFKYSKTTTNTTTQNWVLKTKKDNSSWVQNDKIFSASGATKGTWSTASWNLDGDEVYIMITMSTNNNALRTIDDLEIEYLGDIYSEYTLTPTPAAEISDVEVTIADHGFATLYYSDRNLTVPTGVSAWTFDLNTNNENILVPTEAYPSGSVIPADEAVVLYSANGGTFTFEVAETASAKDANNKLKGTDEAETVTPENGGILYFLGHTTQHGVAFFKGGSSINNGAHKAYLEIPASAKAPALFSIGVDNGTTGINCITIDEDNAGDGAMYDVLGRKVDSNYKGFVIINGKKFMNK